MIKINDVDYHPMQIEFKKKVSPMRNVIVQNETNSSPNSAITAVSSMYNASNTC